MNPQEKRALEAVLDYVERWNKQDSEREAAQASEILQRYLTSTKCTCPKLFANQRVKFHEGGCVLANPDNTIAKV